MHKARSTIRSFQVESILEDFESAAQDVAFDKPSMHYLSSLLGEVIDEKRILGPSYLSGACRETMSFQEALVAARDAGIIKDGNA